MPLPGSHSVAQNALERMKDRLSGARGIYPYPMFLGFGLALVLLVEVQARVNPRLMGSADVITLDTAPLQHSAINLSIFPKGNSLVVEWDDGHVHSWSLTTEGLEPLQPFISHLKSRVHNEIEGAGLAGEVSASRLRVTLAVDQRLKYLHLRPIIYALADAGITLYSFQTQLTTAAKTKPDQSREH